MLSLVKPHLYLTSALKLEAAFLHERGLRGLLLDLDCTLKDYHDDAFCAGVPAWIESMRAADIQMCLLSNGKPRRIELFARRLNVSFVAKAFKPLPHGCLIALKKLGLRSEECGLVGDQIFADILAGRLAGLFTVLVRPTSPREPWFTRLKRPFERGLLRWMNLTPAQLLPRSGLQTIDDTAIQTTSGANCNPRFTLPLLAATTIPEIS